jgi:hypothetical protein
MQKKKQKKKINILLPLPPLFMEGKTLSAAVLAGIVAVVVVACG